MAVLQVPAVPEVTAGASEQILEVPQVTAGAPEQVPEVAAGAPSAWEPGALQAEQDATSAALIATAASGQMAPSVAAEVELSTLLGHTATHVHVHSAVDEEPLHARENINAATPTQPDAAVAAAAGSGVERVQEVGDSSLEQDTQAAIAAAAPPARDSERPSTVDPLSSAEDTAADVSTADRASSRRSVGPRDGTLSRASTSCRTDDWASTHSRAFPVVSPRPSIDCSSTGHASSAAANSDHDRPARASSGALAALQTCAVASEPPFAHVVAAPPVDTSIGGSTSVDTDAWKSTHSRTSRLGGPFEVDRDESSMCTAEEDLTRYVLNSLPDQGVAEQTSAASGAHADSSQSSVEATEPRVAVRSSSLISSAAASVRKADPDTPASEAAARVRMTDRDTPASDAAASVHSGAAGGSSHGPYSLATSHGGESHFSHHGLGARSFCGSGLQSSAGERGSSQGRYSVRGSGLHSSAGGSGGTLSSSSQGRDSIRSMRSMHSMRSDGSHGSAHIELRVSSVAVEALSGTFRGRSMTETELHGAALPPGLLRDSECVVEPVLRRMRVMQPSGTVLPDRQSGTVGGEAVLDRGAGAVPVCNERHSAAALAHCGALPALQKSHKSGSKEDAARGLSTEDDARGVSIEAAAPVRSERHSTAAALAHCGSLPAPLGSRKAGSTEDPARGLSTEGGARGLSTEDPAQGLSAEGATRGLSTECAAQGASTEGAARGARFESASPAALRKMAHGVGARFSKADVQTNRSNARKIASVRLTCIGSSSRRTSQPLHSPWGVPVATPRRAASEDITQRRSVRTSPSVRTRPHMSNSPSHTYQRAAEADTGARAPPGSACKSIAASTVASVAKGAHHTMVPVQHRSATESPTLHGTLPRASSATASGRRGRRFGRAGGRSFRLGQIWDSKAAARTGKGLLGDSNPHGSLRVVRTASTSPDAQQQSQLALDEGRIMTGIVFATSTAAELAEDASAARPAVQHLRSDAAGLGARRDAGTGQTAVSSGQGPLAPSLRPLPRDAVVTVSLDSDSDLEPLRVLSGHASSLAYFTSAQASDVELAWLRTTATSTELSPDPGFSCDGVDTAARRTTRPAPSPQRASATLQTPRVDNNSGASSCNGSDVSSSYAQLERLASRPSMVARYTPTAPPTNLADLGPTIHLPRTYLPSQGGNMLDSDQPATPRTAHGEQHVESHGAQVHVMTKQQPAGDIMCSTLGALGGTDLPRNEGVDATFSKLSTMEDPASILVAHMQLQDTDADWDAMASCGSEHAVSQQQPGKDDLCSTLGPLSWGDLPHNEPRSQVVPKPTDADIMCSTLGPLGVAQLPCMDAPSMRSNQVISKQTDAECMCSTLTALDVSELLYPALNERAKQTQQALGKQHAADIECSTLQGLGVEDLPRAGPTGLPLSKQSDSDRMHSTWRALSASLASSDGADSDVSFAADATPTQTVRTQRISQGQCTQLNASSAADLPASPSAAARVQTVELSTHTQRISQGLCTNLDAGSASDLPGSMAVAPSSQEQQGRGSENAPVPRSAALTSDNRSWRFCSESSADGQIPAAAQALDGACTTLNADMSHIDADMSHLEADVSDLRPVAQLQPSSADGQLLTAAVHMQTLDGTCTTLHAETLDSDFGDVLPKRRARPATAVDLDIVQQPSAMHALKQPLHPTQPQLSTPVHPKIPSSSSASAATAAQDKPKSPGRQQTAPTSRMVAPVAHEQHDGAPFPVGSADLHQQRDRKMNSRSLPGCSSSGHSCSSASDPSSAGGVALVPLQRAPVESDTASEASGRDGSPSHSARLQPVRQGAPLTVWKLFPCAAQPLLFVSVWRLFSCAAQPIVLFA